MDGKKQPDRKKVVQPKAGAYKAGKKAAADAAYTAKNKNTVPGKLGKRAEKTLQESEWLYRSLIECSSDAIFCVDENGVYQFVNQVFASTFGKSPDYFKGKTFWDVYPKEHADHRSANIKRVFQTGKSESIEVEVPLPDRTLFFYATANPLKDETGKVRMVMTHAVDITERKRAEEALMQSEAGISKKLNAILEPEGDIGSLELSDILDYRSIQLMMDDFYSLSGIGVAIADTRGKILVATGWQDICTQFHRVNPETQKYCLESDVTLASDAAPGQVKLYKCKNNMWDVATPIYLGEKHMGNVFYGQFFFTDEMPDYDVFRQQARRHGFDEQAYIAALDRSNRWDRDKIDLIMAFYARFATMISQLSYSAIKLSRLLAANDKTLAALKESEEQFRFLVNYSYDLIWRLKPDGVFSYVSPSWKTILGYEPSSVVDRAFQPFVHPDDVEECEKYMVRVMDAKKPLPGQQYRVRHSNGTWQWHETSMSPVVGDDGSLMYFVGVSRDITEQKLAEEALRLSEEKYRSLFEESIAVVYAFDRKKNFIDTNQAGLDLVGYSREELLTMHISDVDVDYEVVLPAQQNILSGGRINNFEHRLRRKDGTIITVLNNSRPLKDHHGKEVGILSTLIDITDRKHLEEEHQRVNKLESVGLLAGGIAHDFNNILTSILGNISLAKMDAAPGSELKNSLEQAEKASQRARALTVQLLTFSKGGAPVLKLAPLTELLKDTAGFALSGSKVKCRFSIPAGLWHAEIDAGQVSQVIHNLVINAQQAMPNGGSIEISAENMALSETQSLGRGLPLKAGNYVRISVADHGCGIPVENLEKVFDPFFTTRQKGNGMGLAVSFSIARQHGGHISVESEPGTGSTFFLYLPASTQTAVPEQATEGTVKPAGNIKILVMDDEQGVREIAGRLLKHIGYKDIEFAEDGAEAIKLYKAAMKSGNPFTVAILDLTIAGGMGGEIAIQNLLLIDPGIKAIVSSGYIDDPVIANFKAHGFSGVVAKPYTIEELRKAVQDVIPRPDGLPRPSGSQ